MAEHDGPFSADALSTNQSGRLTDEQLRHWQRIARGRRKDVRGVAYVFAAIAALLLLVPGPQATAAARVNGGVAFLALTAILLVATHLEPVNADVREGRVESIEGAIAKRDFALRQRGIRFFAFDVGGRRLRAMGRASYDAAPDGGYVRVYFLPRSRRVVNLEQLADPAIPSGAGGAREIMQNYAQARRSGDRVAIAEANASVAALKRVIEGPPPRTDGNDRGHKSQLRPDDLFGTWTNPLVTIQFMNNGIATMTPALGGARQDGHWSVDEKGRLLTNATGTMEPLDASLDGDRLTIVFRDQRVQLTRQH